MSMQTNNVTAHTRTHTVYCQKIMNNEICKLYTLWVRKRDLYAYAHNFGRCWRIFEIFSLLNSSRNLQQTDCDIAHQTLSVLLHYLVKW